MGCDNVAKEKVLSVLWICSQLVENQAVKNVGHWGGWGPWERSVWDTVEHSRERPAPLQGSGKAFITRKVVFEPSLKGWVGICPAYQAEEAIPGQGNSICSMGWTCQLPLSLEAKENVPSPHMYNQAATKCLHLQSPRSALISSLLHLNTQRTQFLRLSSRVNSFRELFLDDIRLLLWALLFFKKIILAVPEYMGVSSNAPWAPWEQILCLVHLNSPLPGTVPGTSHEPISSWGMKRKANSGSRHNRHTDAHVQMKELSFQALGLWPHRW